ncbi:MAG: HdeD family acid-resistance protein [Cyanobium sp.]
MAPELYELISTASDAGRLARDNTALRTFTLGEGVVMLVLGFLALIFPAIASLWITAVVAIGFLVGGIVGWLNTLARAPRLSGAIGFWRLTVSSLFLVTGIWMVRQLAAGPAGAARQVAALALAIGVVFLVEGVVAAVVALSHRQVKGWGWGLTNGIVTLILGLLILTLKELSLLWVLGTLVGISFLFSGLDLLTFSASFHGLPPGESTRPSAGQKPSS